MKKWLITILFGSALVLGACGGGGDDGATEDSSDNGSEDTEESADGSVDSAAAKELVQQNNCTSCHGSDLSGGGVGPDLTSVGADHSADDIVKIIHEGQGDMPPQKQVSDEDAQTIASWLAQKK